MKVPVPVEKDPGKDHIGVSDALMESIARYIKFPVPGILPKGAFSVVRKSFDARKVGLRIEHPQEVINKIQYSKFAGEVQKGRGKVPVADYKVATYLNEDDVLLPFSMEQNSRACYSFCMCPGGQFTCRLSLLVQTHRSFV